MSIDKLSGKNNLAKAASGIMLSALALSGCGTSETPAPKESTSHSNPAHEKKEHDAVSSVELSETELSNLNKTAKATALAMMGEFPNKLHGDSHGLVDGWDSPGTYDKADKSFALMSFVDFPDSYSEDGKAVKVKHASYRNLDIDVDGSLGGTEIDFSASEGEYCVKLKNNGREKLDKNGKPIFVEKGPCLIETGQDQTLVFTNPDMQRWGRANSRHDLVRFLRNPHTTLIGARFSSEYNKNDPGASDIEYIDFKIVGNSVTSDSYINTDDLVKAINRQ